MPHIFISYRRADSDAMAGRIRDRLAHHFGERSVFMDIDSVPFGIDFREHIQETLSHNDILVSIIGPRWIGSGKGGHYRISEETDPVRIELETALKSGSAVIPVLVGGAKMPRPSELPDSLKDFSYRNAAEVDTGRDFHQHMERLIRSMESLLAGRSPALAAGSKKESAASTAVGLMAAPQATADASLLETEATGSAGPQPDERATAKTTTQADQEPGAASEHAGGARFQRLRYAVLVSIVIGIYLAARCWAIGDVISFAVAAVMTAAGFWLIYRKLSNNVTVAKITSLVCACITGYFILLNDLTQDVRLAAIELVSASCLLYVFFELTQLPRSGSQKRP